nr:RNA exonuclease 5-like [Equus caballus]
MEPERGRTGALLQKGRKRRRARGKHVGAAEARRARSEPEERRPGAKIKPRVYQGSHFITLCSSLNSKQASYISMKQRKVIKKPKGKIR